MKKNYAIEVKGKSGRTFSFPFKGNEKYLQEWRDEGFEIYEVLNTVPVWVAELRLTRPWCAAQDTWQWLRLW